MSNAGLMLIALSAFALCGCSRPSSQDPVHPVATQHVSPPAPGAAIDPPVGFQPGGYRGFDRNDYPGDDVMARMQSEYASFAFTGYWLTNPPGETTNTWQGKRALLLKQGWGFLVLANGKLDAEILKAQRAGTSPAALGRRDAANAVEAAKREGFPAGTIIFLDQEEGGRLLDEQATYLLAWTEAVAGSGFRAGVYASGQRVQDGPGVWIDTVEDIRARVKKGGLHDVAIFDALDQCPPSPGCTIHAKPLSAAPDLNLTAWQYSQSPRRPEITQSCGSTYAADGNCYAPGFPQVFLDMDASDSADPSHGR
jgi:hypothetical protein